MTFYTSEPDGLFRYQISGTTDVTEINIVKSAFDRWDTICKLDKTQFNQGQLIDVSYSVADLAAGILGSAALQTFRSNDSGLTSYGNIMAGYGYITLNTDYTASMITETRNDGKTTYYHVVMHELGHILGIGTLWFASNISNKPISSYTEDSTTKYYYTGTAGVSQYRSYLNSPENNLIIGIPVEDDGSAGTVNVHTEEGLEGTDGTTSADDRYLQDIYHPGLNTELMTGWMDSSPSSTPLSRISLGLLEDIGYIVDYTQADSFTIVYTGMSTSNFTDEQVTNTIFDSSFGYHENANRLKQTYVKTFADISGNIKLRNNSTLQTTGDTVVKFLGENTVVKEIKQDLSFNINLFVGKDASFNQNVYIKGDLSVNGSIGFPENSLSDAKFTNLSESVAVNATNAVDHNNSNILTSLDISGHEIYVAGDSVFNGNNFKVGGNLYVNSFIQDEHNEVVMQDDTLINYLDISDNLFSITKEFTAGNRGSTNYANIATSDFTSNNPPFISSNGKVICFPTYKVDTNKNYHNTVFSNNYGMGFSDLAVRLGGTAGATNEYGVTAFHATENSKYIYGLEHHNGMIKSSDYGSTFTAVNSVDGFKLRTEPSPDTALISTGAGVFDTSYSSVMCSSINGQYVYIGGFYPFYTSGPNTTTDAGHFLLKSIDFGTTFTLDASATDLNMVPHSMVDDSMNALVGARSISCSANGKYVVCAVSGKSYFDKYNSADISANTASWYPVLSKDYGNNWNIINGECFYEYYVNVNKDVSFNTTNNEMLCVGANVSSTGKYIGFVLHSSQKTDLPQFVYVSSDYGKTFSLKTHVNRFSNSDTAKLYGVQFNISPDGEYMSITNTKGNNSIDYSYDYGNTWYSKALLVGTDNGDGFTTVSKNFQFAADTEKTTNGAKVYKHITPYKKTYFTHAVLEPGNITNGDQTVDNSITYNGGTLTTSDYRLKENITALTDETIDNLRPVKFNFAHNNKKSFGLIAHEVQEHFPYLVEGEKDGANHQTVNYTGLLGLLVHELQEIKKGISELENQ